MATTPGARAREELSLTGTGLGGLFRSTLLFSVFSNLLVLTGPLFMLQVYDRVLASRSEETLVALTVLVAALWLFYGLVAGFIGPGPAMRGVGLIALAGFLAIWLLSLLEAERPDPTR